MKTICYICMNRMDRFFIWATPDGKKYPVCRKCLTLAKNLFGKEEK